MKERATKKQQLLLQFIQDFVREHGYGPSYREIMNGLEYKSVSTVATHVDGLIARGWLRKRTHSARSLEVVSGGSAEPAELTKDHGLAVSSGVSQQITTKLDELLADEETALTDIDSLVRSLALLGFEQQSEEYASRRDHYAKKEYNQKR